MPALLNSLKRKIDIIHILIILSFVIWVYVFRGFLFGKLAISGDALPYFDHFKYYIDHLMKGIYPMWDPFIPDGVPNEFFLRRIGSFNPFYFIIMVFRWMGLKFELAYLFFLALYYWLGMIGFYLLSVKIFKDRFCAFISYFLLMYSSMSTVLFSSFLILSVVPIIWFFYFMFIFFEDDNRIAFLGMIFCLMIVTTTYLPFYFLHNLLLWLICFALYFPIRLWGSVKKMSFFLWKNKLFSVLSLACLVLALSAGYFFFKEMASGEYVMPVRHKDIDTLNTLMVAPQTYIDGGIMATSLVDEQLNYFDRFILGRFYIPIVFCVFMLLGIIVRTNKRILFLLTWAFMALISGVYEASPVYKFLYDHIFYVKYMRNFQYFLWINLLPVLILLSVENLNVFLNALRSRKNKQVLDLTAVFIIHAVLIIYFIVQKSGWLLPASLGLSGLFFYFQIRNAGAHPSKWVWSIILFAILLHPVQAYLYLAKNSPPKSNLYYYETAGIQNFTFGLPIHAEFGKVYSDDEIKKILASNITTASKWFNLKSNYDFYKSIPMEAIDNLSRLELYDFVERINYHSPDFGSIIRLFLKQENKALVDQKEMNSNFEIDHNVLSGPRKAIVPENSREVAVKMFQPNVLGLECNLSKNKFLVYRDNYEKHWEVFVDGKKERLYKANLTYKGVWVPAGKHIVVFKYGQGWYEQYQKLMLFIFYAVFCVLLLLICCKKPVKIKVVI